MRRSVLSILLGITCAPLQAKILHLSLEEGELSSQAVQPAFSPSFKTADSSLFRLMRRISLEEGIPFRLLESIVYIESGFHPWTLNIDGKPCFFATQHAAEQALASALRKGFTNIDIGCAQINWGWHGKAFTHPKDLLRPETSLRTAARLLRHHNKATHSWMKAALLYHSRNKVRQRVYHKRLIQYLTGKQRV